MRDSVPSASYSSVCNVLHQWNISLIPTYRVYRLYDIYIYSSYIVLYTGLYWTIPKLYSSYILCCIQVYIGLYTGYTVTVLCHMRTIQKTDDVMEIKAVIMQLHRKWEDLTDCCADSRSDTYGSRDPVPCRCGPTFPLGSFLAGERKREGE